MISDPAAILEQLERLRDFARRCLDPTDLGRTATRDLKNAARRALYGERPTQNHFPQERRPQ